MSAQDHLNPAQFFHGTKRDFKPGDLITSATSRKASSSFSPTGTEAEHTFMTTRYSNAEYYAHEPTGSNFPGDRPRVYKVEPTGPYEPDPREDNSYRSKHPLRVVEDWTD